MVALAVVVVVAVAMVAVAKLRVASSCLIFCGVFRTVTVNE